MATYKSSRDINTLTVAAYDLKSASKTLTIDGMAEELDGSSMTERGERIVDGQRNANISMTLMTNDGVDCDTKVNSSYLTVFTLGGTSYKTVVKTITFDMSVKNVDVSSPEDTFKSFQNLQHAFSASADLMVLKAASHAIWGLWKTGSLQAVWSLTINGETITLPMTITQVSIQEDGENVVILRVQLKGRPACGVAAFPTAPTVGSSLITSFLVDPYSTATFEFKSAASNGETLDCDVLLTSLSFTIASGQLLETTYNFTSTGICS